MTRREPLARLRASRARQIAMWILIPAMAAGGRTIAYPAAIAGTASQPATASGGEELVKQLVVMLRGFLGEQSFNGAGVIIGRTPDRLYIATAHHVVRQATQQADRIEAQFRWLPGEWKTVNVLADGDVDLDLAVLAADARGFSIPDLPWGSLGDPKGLAPGSRVFPVGFPNAMPWFRPQQSHVVNTVTAQQIRTEGQVFPGNSGGALVTEDWRLVGLVSNVTAVLAGSTRMDLIVEKLKEWRYPVTLAVPTKSSTPPPDAGPKVPDPTGTCAVSGVVVDGSSSRPLSGVNVGLAARMPGGGERIEALERTAAVTAQDGTFRFTCPPTIARERFPLELIVWHADWRTQRPKVEIQSGDRLANVVVPVTLPRATGTDPEPMDDCVAIRPGALRVDYNEGRGGWHVMTQGPSAWQVLLPDFEANENGARTLALVLQKYNVTEYCQIGRPPAVFYFLSRGAPVLMGARGRGGPGAVDVVEQCRAFNPAALAVAEPDTMTGRDWSIRDAGRMVLSVADQALARRTLATIRRHGFTSVCYPGRPMRYLR